MTPIDIGRREMVEAIQNYIFWLSGHVSVMPDHALAGTFNRVGELATYMDKAWPIEEWRTAYNNEERPGG